MKEFIATAMAGALALATFSFATAQMQSGTQDQYGAGTQGAQSGSPQYQGGQPQPGQQTGQRQQWDRQPQARSDEAQRMQKAASTYLDGKQIMNATVKDRTGKDIGSVSNLIFDRSGKVSYVILSHGGVAGMGGKKIAVPAGAVTLSGSEEKKQVMVNASEADLNSAPEYNSLADLVSPKFTETTYRFFGIQPQWSEQGASGGQQTEGTQSQWRLQDMPARQQTSR